MATKRGIIQGMHSRNTFYICTQKLLKLEELSLLAINGIKSISGGQGFLRCNCADACSKHYSFRKVPCDSECHKNLKNNSYTYK